MSCLLCRRHRGEAPVLGGTIHEDDLVRVGHGSEEGQSTAYRGWLVVETRRHVAGLADLTEPEGQAIGIWVARLARALKESEGAEHVYCFVLGHKVPHVHVHVVPRYPNTPKEHWGFRILEWPGAPLGDDPELRVLCERIRALACASGPRFNSALPSE